MVGRKRSSFSMFTENQPRSSLKQYIRSKYGVEMCSTTQNYEKSLHGIARFKTHLIFSLRCKNEKLIPYNLRVKPLVKTRAGYRFAERSSCFYLRERIRWSFCQKERFEVEAGRLERVLERSMTPEDFDRIADVYKRAAEKIFHNTRTRQIRKLERLRESTRRMVEGRGIDRMRWVVNLSKHELTTEERDVLSLGLNFASAPWKIP